MTIKQSNFAKPAQAQSGSILQTGGWKGACNMIIVHAETGYGAD
jgi:hypothetical protein